MHGKTEPAEAFASRLDPPCRLRQAAAEVEGEWMSVMSIQPEWLDELDALRHHALLFGNEFVRVLDTRVPPGQAVPLHTHRWPSVLYILNWSDFVRRDGDGRTVVPELCTALVFRAPVSLG